MKKQLELDPRNVTLDSVAAITRQHAANLAESQHDTYAQLPGLNATAIKRGAVSMLHMRACITEPQSKDTTATRWGRLVHAAILEPSTLFKHVAIWDGDRKSGKVWDAFELDASGSEIVTPDELAYLQRIGAAVHGNGEAHRLIERTRHEVIHQWDSPTYACAKCRFDGINSIGSCVIELKTTRNIMPEAFARQVHGPLRYDLGAGWYCEGYSYAAGGLPSYHFIVVESAPPYHCVVMTVGQHYLEKWRAAAVAIAETYRACERAGTWPGPTGERMDYIAPDWAAVVGVDGLNMEGIGDANE